jgi:hypothetical protein
MRENEKAALQQVVEILQGLLGGQVPAAQPRAAAPAQARARAPIAVKEGDVHLQWDEENNGYGCLVCGEGVFKVGEAAEHAFTSHGIPLAALNATDLTHGRKWMMKKYLEKHAPEALEGYGRGVKAAEKPAKTVAAPAKPIKKWTPFKKKAAEPEAEAETGEAVEETESKHVTSSLRELHSVEKTDQESLFNGHIASYKNDGMTHFGEIIHRNGNVLFVRDVVTGEERQIRSNQIITITPYKASEYTSRLTNRSL